MGALNTYIGQVQDLLHDPLAQMWSVTQVTAYVNEARNRVAQDSKAIRQVLQNAQFPTLQFNAGDEFITPQTFLPPPYGSRIVDVLGISITVNQERLVLIQKPYTWINAMLRSWVNYRQWPTFFARLSPISICIAPVPNIAYPCDWDIAINPNPLLDDTTVEELPVPFMEPVQYYASYKAKLNQQSQGESQMFLGMYNQILRTCARSYMQRIVQNPYQASVG